VFSAALDGADTRTVVEWFDRGGIVPLGDDVSAAELVSRTRGVQGLRDVAARAGAPPDAPTPVVASAIDFVLEGLCAQKKISRNEERGYTSAGETTPRRPTRLEEQMLQDDMRVPGGKKKYYN
jgi:magnesium chelatase subunit I